MDLVQQLAQALLPEMERQRGRMYGLKHDSGGSPQGYGYVHGPGGLLTFPGVDPDVFNAAVGSGSILNQLPATPSVEMNPTFWVLTGIQGTSGSNKNGVCDDAPEAGLMKACLQTSVFGRYELATPELELNRLGQRIDRADPMDLRLVGTPLGNSLGSVFGAGGSPGDPSTPADVFSNEIANKFWERNVAFHRLLSLQLWAGNPANNSAGGGYKELTSFSRLVTTGYVDAETNVACPAADSYLSNFANARIDTNGDALVAAITDMYYQLKDRADRSGVSPVRWVIAMRPQLFYEIAALWPCSYLTQKCQTSGTDTLNIDARDAVQFRDEMRAGKYLLIDGDKVEVVTDDGIPELNGNETGSIPRGCFSTDIYFIPMSVQGGRAVTFLQYFQYSNPAITDALNNLVLGVIEGAFLTWPRQQNQCFQWQSKIEPRLIMRTPWLAGRIQNVVYCPIQHTRDAFPSEPYFADGGRTNRVAQGPSYYHVW